MRPYFQASYLEPVWHAPHESDPYAMSEAEQEQAWAEWVQDQKNEQEFRELVGDDKVFSWLWHGDPYNDETPEQLQDRMATARDVCESDEQFERLFYDELYSEIDPVLIARYDLADEEAYYSRYCR